MTKIKICGITNEKDALWAANTGVDFIGLNFYKNSPRKISVDMAKRIVSKLPEFVKSVGIFVDEEIETILKIVKKVQLKLIQLHGNETPEFCDELKERITNTVPANSLWENRPQIIKVFRIKPEQMFGNQPLFRNQPTSEVVKTEQKPNKCSEMLQTEQMFGTEHLFGYKSIDYFLFDTFVENLQGGTGQTFNWDLAVEIKKAGKPIFLSGGLTPENVTNAIKKVEPFAVDVCSGIERTPTRKDYDKMLAFVKAVRKV
ncbi:MAG: phosphoribosylanthranilate isomerase [Elusimicrobiota bacterium]